MNEPFFDRLSRALARSRPRREAIGEIGKHVFAGSPDEGFFDGVSRALASPMPRGKALRVLGTAIAVGVASSRAPSRAFAGRATCPPNESACGDICYTPSTEKCCQGPRQGNYICSSTSVPPYVSVQQCCGDAGCCNEGWKCDPGAGPPSVDGFTGACCPPDKLICGRGCADFGSVCCTSSKTYGACKANQTCCFSAGGKGFECCDPGQICCGGVVAGNSLSWCCADGETCGSSGNCTPKPCPRGEHRCGGFCCKPDQICEPRTKRCVNKCKNGQEKCGKHCCPKGTFCCDPSKGLCCKTKGGECCFEKGKRFCCQPPTKCAPMIASGQAGVTAHSPHVCCPKDRLVPLYTGVHICCPPGTVSMGGKVVVPPGGGGGLCCAKGKACGKGKSITCCGPGQSCSGGTCVG